MSKKQPPIYKTATPSQSYVIHSAKKVSILKYISRFIVRYFIPTIVIAATIVGIDTLVFKYKYSNIVLISITVGISFVAALISYLWFRLISKNQQ